MYTSAFGLVILPLTANIDVPWYYPVQKALFLTNYSNKSLFDFLPDRIPETAENYSVLFTPKILQGEALITISFITDTAALRSLEAKAVSYGAMKYDNGHDNARQCKNILIQDGQPTDGAVVYRFENGKTRYTANYIINENTGYFRLYW